MNNITENIMANAIKSLFSFGKKIGECIAIDPDIYFEYIVNVKSEIMPFLPYNYLCIEHKHKDNPLSSINIRIHYILRYSFA